MSGGEATRLRIVDLAAATPAQRERAAGIMVSAFAETAPAYCNTLDEAREEVADFDHPARIARLALDDAGEVVGWIGGQPHYEGWVWELHPLAVAPTSQGVGIGRALVADLEDRVRERGAMTLWLGTDDETNQTTLGGSDLYPGALEKLQAMADVRRHASGFYLRLGFEVVGVLPDANGFGKPDIWMAKRVGDPAGPPPAPAAEGTADDTAREPLTDDQAMARCRELADEARSRGNTGVGCVLVLDGRIVGEAAEAAPVGGDPFAHAEIIVARDAVRRFGRSGLRDATLFSTAEPCFLCSYGVREAGVGRVVLGAPVADIGGVTSAHPILLSTDVPRWGAPPEVEWWQDGKEDGAV